MSQNLLVHVRLPHLSTLLCEHPLLAQSSSVTLKQWSDLAAAVKRYEPWLVLLCAPPERDLFRALASVHWPATHSQVFWIWPEEHAPEAADLGQAYEWGLGLGLGTHELGCLDHDLKQLKHKHEAQRASAQRHASQSPKHACGALHTPTLRKAMQHVSNTEGPVLITGEIGTGKAKIVQHLHESSARAEHPLVRMHCGACQDKLMDAELFGLMNTQAQQAPQITKGRLERAAQGTLFLEHIDMLPMRLQHKILDVIQEQQFARLGDPNTQPINVRVMMTTEQDPKHLVREGLLHEALYWQCQTHILQMPPLREHPDVVVRLAKECLAENNLSLNKAIKGLKEEALHRLVRHAWPGNLRELKQCMKKACLACDGHWISAHDLDLDEDLMGLSCTTLRQIREDSERKAIATALHVAQFNCSRAAELLGITRPTLYNLMEKLGLKTGVEHESHAPTNSEKV